MIPVLLGSYKDGEENYSDKHAGSNAPAGPLIALLYRNNFLCLGIMSTSEKFQFWVTTDG